MLGPDGPDEADQGVAGWEDAHYVGPPRAINRLRWHLHELDPSWEPPARCLWRPKHLSAILQRLDGVPGTVARLARGLVERCRLLSMEILDLDKEVDQLMRRMAPTLLGVCGCATLNAA